MLIRSSYTSILANATQVRPTCTSIQRTRTNIPQHIPSAQCNVMDWDWVCVTLFHFFRFPSHRFCCTVYSDLFIKCGASGCDVCNDGFAMRFSRLSSSRLCRGNEWMTLKETEQRKMQTTSTEQRARRYLEGGSEWRNGRWLLKWVTFEDDGDDVCGIHLKEKAWLAVLTVIFFEIWRRKYFVLQHWNFPIYIEYRT